MMRTAVSLFVLAALLGGCRQSMDRQPKLATYSEAEAFPNRAAARPLPAGATDRDAPLRDAALITPPQVTAELLARGQERYNVYCSPCHSASGHGDGMIVERGFPRPPSYHIPRLLATPAQHFVDVITNGYGIMYPYAERVGPSDRWAIAAYIRALQLSQNSELVKQFTRSSKP